MTTIQPEVPAGIDTHADTHHVAVIDADGRRLGDAGFPATLIGYQAIAAFIGAFGLVQHVGIEGTHSYGAGVTMHLQSAGIRVVEVIRPNREVGRMRGKSDPIDAYEAAKAVLAGPGHPEPKQLDGVVEALRYGHAASQRGQGACCDASADQEPAGHLTRADPRQIPGITVMAS
ncbi:IS110 family transposase [Microbacterium sp. LWH7-1.2]|jgi:transposase|uniref:IS110 family transposase n=1 Tax=Microbacterium sp. LWH7-1.2 TaxID=3135257 RepID=UPI003139F7DB